MTAEAQRVDHGPPEVHGNTPESPIVGAPARVTVGPQGDLVWRGLRETWLAHQVVQQHDAHVKGGFAWSPGDYGPVFVLDEDGDPLLSFRRAWTPG